MKRVTIIMSTIVLAVLILLAGCQPIADERQNNIMSTETPAPTLEVTPTPDPTLEPMILTPWQEAYRDILLHPEEYEEFYAVAEHIPSYYSERPKGAVEDGDPYYFALSDLDRDGIPELLLGLGIIYRDPRVLLNILCWNEETDTVDDMDGPRTYPLMDWLFVYDTGYFGTENGAGGLYIEFWHLEDEDPDHYWYGYERSAHFNDKGELESWMEFPFADTNGEQLTLQEYYALLGESSVDVDWQELTEENIQKAFLPVTGEEEP